MVAYRQPFPSPTIWKNYIERPMPIRGRDLIAMRYGFGTICASNRNTQSFYDPDALFARTFQQICLRGDEMLRILVADDHEVARRGICALLEGHPGWEVCAEAKDGREAVELVAGTKPDLVLLDIGMPNLNGLEAARQILAASPDIAILILTMHDSDNVVREVLRAGARGFVFKSDAGRDLVAAVEALQLQRTFFTTRVSQMVLDGFLDWHKRDGKDATDNDDPSVDPLTSREREVIQLLAEGKTSKEVAVTLNLSVKTAETHRTNLMRKLGLHSVADLTRYAVRNGIVQVF
jgi:DNA-binding NarL/FixJ family response regulator